MNSPTTVDAYIAAAPAELQPRLQKVRAAIRRAAPRAEESIKYRIPAYVQEGHLIFFSIFKNHIGVYPRTAGMEQYAEELAPYRAPGRSFHFPHDRPVPYGLIGKLAKVRLQENRALAEAKLAKQAAKTKKPQASAKAKTKAKKSRR